MILEVSARALRRAPEPGPVNVQTHAHLSPRADREEPGINTSNLFSIPEWEETIQPLWTAVLKRLTFTESLVTARHLCALYYLILTST